MFRFIYAFQNPHQLLRGKPQGEEKSALPLSIGVAFLQVEVDCPVLPKLHPRFDKRKAPRRA
jgi:hypothetical protein